jgi:hypothetical protein
MPSEIELQTEIHELRQELKRLEHKVGARYRGPEIDTSPVQDYRSIVKDSNDPGYVNRLLIATATTGLVRVEWVAGRYGQIVPTNWSHVQMMQFIHSFMPLRYQVADAQNLIVRECLEKEFEWLLLIEHDTIPPADTFVRLNEYILRKDTPVVSGLYYTRSRPSEPLIYRGRGTSYYTDWEMGDLVWCDGVPTGMLLIHAGILRAMWDESEEYVIQDPNGRQEIVRKVFDTPRKQWFDQDTGQYNSRVGTSDLDWCTRVMEEGFFEKAGWPEYQELEFPFVVDTNIFCRHIDQNGVQYP